ncbi:hypothetical protein SCUCBS95973_009681 [Sporothrix curviconia]|uniref:Alkyl hydroperoxide reductase subunit C/ Thiol specific antioxidant domain-containing protein n=1 Tax=Sporothrix curviconia TaxID=1260050 RepID=A0ABP0CWZ2_9PEZI
MPGIKEELSATLDGFQKNAPDQAKLPITEALDNIVKTFDYSATIQKGQPLPDFTHFDAFASRGVTLVAISPELPDTSLTTTEKLDLKFPVLSDVGNAFAAKLGIVWKQPDTLRPVFEAFGHNIPKRTGNDSYEVPVPTTLLVDGKGIVRNIFVDADYTKRLDPEVAIGWVDAL